MRDPDQTARPRARWAVPAYRWLLLVFLLIAACAGVQYALARRR